jgi:translation initiation factor 1A
MNRARVSLTEPNIHYPVTPHYISLELALINNHAKKPGESEGAAEFNPDGTPAVRVRLPKKKLREQFACAELMMGANHIRVRCMDGVERMGRIKGKIKKRAWIREGDIVIVVPWSFQDEKCDILYRYLPPQADWLRKNNYLS